MPALIAGVICSNPTADIVERLRRAIEVNGSVRRPSVWSREGVTLMRAELDPDPDESPPNAATFDWQRGALVADFFQFGDANGSGSAPESLLSTLETGDLKQLGALEADFAFAAWDTAQEELLLARDQIGVRPLFYVHHPKKFFAFASLVGILRDAGVTAARPDPIAVARYAVGDEATGDETLWQDVRRVPAGHVLRFRRGRIRVQRYWRLPVPAFPNLERTRGNHAAEVRRLMEEAVGRRVRTVQIATAHLSGGLDSTSVAMLAARALARTGGSVRGQAYVGPDRRDVEVIDNRPYVEAALQREPNLSFTPVASVRIMDVVSAPLVPGMMLLQGAADPFVRLDRAAEGHGPILSGLGGDECLSNNGRGALTELALRFLWSRLRRELVRRAKDMDIQVAPWRILASSFVGQMPEGIAAALRRAAGLPQPKRALAPYLTEEAQRHLRRERGGFSVRHNCRHRIEATALQNALEGDATRAARSGRSHTYPLLDVALLGFVARLPAEAFLHDGSCRALMRDATEGLLPEAVRLMSTKLGSHPCLVLEAAEGRSEILRTIRRLRDVEALPFDFAALEQAAIGLPEPCVRLEEINRLAAQGRTPDESSVGFLQVLLAARCLAEWIDPPDCLEDEGETTEANRMPIPNGFG